MLYCGPRVRIGLHVGTPKRSYKSTRERFKYKGSSIIEALKTSDAAHGGQVRRYLLSSLPRIAACRAILLFSAVRFFELLCGNRCSSLERPTEPSRCYVTSSSANRACSSAQVSTR